MQALTCPQYKIGTFSVEGMTRDNMVDTVPSSAAMSIIFLDRKVMYAHCCYPTTFISFLHGKPSMKTSPKFQHLKMGFPFAVSVSVRFAAGINVTNTDAIGSS